MSVRIAMIARPTPNALTTRTVMNAHATKGTRMFRINLVNNQEGNAWIVRMKINFRNKWYNFCSASNECAERSLNTCDENADCIDTPQGYSCQCFAGYVDVSMNAYLPPGRVCTVQTSCPKQKTDLIFLIDGSGSIGSQVKGYGIFLKKVNILDSRCSAMRFFASSKNSLNFLTLGLTIQG